MYMDFLIFYYNTHLKPIQVLRVSTLFLENDFQRQITCTQNLSIIVCLYVFIHFFVYVCVAAVSPSVSSYNETLSTLRYAAHARNIVNKPRVNEVSGCSAPDDEIGSICFC